jgi:hypothetical protein
LAYPSTLPECDRITPLLIGIISARKIAFHVQEIGNGLYGVRVQLFDKVHKTVKPPRPKGRGFCPAAAPRVRGASRSSPFDAHEIILILYSCFARNEIVLIFKGIYDTEKHFQN